MNPVIVDVILEVLTLISKAVSIASKAGDDAMLKELEALYQQARLLVGPVQVTAQHVEIVDERKA